MYEKKYCVRERWYRPHFSIKITETNDAIKKKLYFVLEKSIFATTAGVHDLICQNAPGPSGSAEPSPKIVLFIDIANGDFFGVQQAHPHNPPEKIVLPSSLDPRTYEIWESRLTPRLRPGC